MKYEYDFEFDKAPTIQSAILQAIGAASTSWENFWTEPPKVNTGVFLEQRALAISEQLLDNLRARVTAGEVL